MASVYHEEPIATDGGEGRTVWDVEGNEYLDFFGGILTTMIGHNIPEITNSVQAHGVTPDLITFAKGVGNGLSLGGVVGRAEIIDSMPANSISSFLGNPLSSAGAVATPRYLLDHELQYRALVSGRRLRKHLDDIAVGVDWIAEVRGKGLLQGIETVQPEVSRQHPSGSPSCMSAVRRGAC